MASMNNIEYHIGIDPGVKTGIAIWHRPSRKFVDLITTDLDSAWDKIREYSTDVTMVYLENPNLRKWFGKSGKERYQGAGSVKRDYGIWRKRLIADGYHWMDVSPQSVKSAHSHIVFKYMTGYAGARTSQHSRDAAMMVYGR
jgi:hypothetical protein